ncbi:FRG domain-containing protein [Megasphaera paucivorans]|uniref:FRG domain-containing protein n=1 Tax=Megasphaera paucivorans TaxID=349095 RepID=A0A1G9QEZ9_9FIRM|nr:FRG domain-containing protein [Megasphaera paucivorans]SDM08875.1 FRG domain-containing protein [Megasphaera paucivorans]
MEEEWQSVKTVEYDSFLEFYEENFIEPITNKKNRTGKCLEFNYKDFIFRGMHDASYELIPSFHRWFRSSPYYSLVSGNYQTAFESCFFNEFKFLEEFYKQCNFQGLPIPGDINLSKYQFTQIYSNKEILETMTNTDLENIKKNVFENVMEKGQWVSDMYLNFVALAQHYGLPTRMLDWTFDVRVAAYFATLKNLKKRTNRSYVIWALNTAEIGTLRYKKIKTQQDTIPLEFVVPQYSQNPNICAQKGILTTWRLNLCTDEGKESYENELRDTNNAALEKLISDYCKNSFNDDDWKGIVKKMDNEAVLYKFIFPSEDINSTLRFLREQDYLTAHLFPGYKGCADQSKNWKVLGLL